MRTKPALCDAHADALCLTVTHLTLLARPFTGSAGAALRTVRVVSSHFPPGSAIWVPCISGLTVETPRFLYEKEHVMLHPVPPVVEHVQEGPRKHALPTW